ncbi:permease component of an ABC superfamily maltose/maltodextrin transporter [Buttiauxella brennerae ATCC 51605]|uniref:Permease component of an ABC superfamily maltose/maltodextrin transporter n=1 Tax=Buttiauxella brennerae ATCC 51605 TaxID=1354251 RepID=A0A1B7IN24_9ENTR|nr:sugar ABC transporter permease [Buttiauxella brennerae]OAT31049.1 permease component of an ABC superfamily maltose/maltodextrin transporter [Buttiauxella brennerae ATCC 51605]
MKGKTNWRSQQRNAWLAGLMPSIILLVVITLLPAMALIITSLTPLSLTNPQETFNFSDPLINYRQLLEDPRFLNSIITQIKLSLVSVLFQVIIGLGLALLLNGTSAWLHTARTLFLIPMVLPPIIVALIWKIIYTPDISPLHQVLELWGITLNSLIANPATALWAIAVADIWQWFPFTMLMVLAALQMIPRDPLEAASLDGASARNIFRYIVLPYIKPVLVVCALFRLIDSFKAFPLIYILTDGGPGTVTEVTNYYGFIQAFNFSYWGYGSAIAVVILVGVFVLSYIIGKAGWSDERKASA